MLTKKLIRSNHFKIRLSGTPDLVQINDASIEVAASSGKRLQFHWFGKECEYKLTVLAPLRGTSLWWQLDVIAGSSSKTLWTHSSCDVPLIHNLILSACGQESETVEADGMLAASAAYRHVTQKHDLYYTKTESSTTGGHATAAVFALKGLIASAKTGVAGSHPPSAPKNKAQTAIEEFKKEIKDSETGLYTEAAMLFFLEQEYFRSYRASAPVSFLLLRVKGTSNNGWPSNSLPTSRQITSIVQGIDKVRRHSDLVGRYDGDDIAIILPNTDSKGADCFARKVLRQLQDASIMGESGANNLTISLGIASVPDDSIDLTTLTQLAESTVYSAYARCCSIVGHSDYRAI